MKINNIKNIRKSCFFLFLFIILLINFVAAEMNDSEMSDSGSSGVGINDSGNSETSNEINQTVYPYIDSDINEVFNNQDWNYIRIKLLDTSGIEIPNINELSGTKEEKREIINQLSLEKNNWFDLRNEELILELSTEDFQEIHKSSLGITALTNFEGYNRIIELAYNATLINGTQIESITLLQAEIVTGVIKEDELTEDINDMEKEETIKEELSLFERFISFIKNLLKLN